MKGANVKKLVEPPSGLSQPVNFIMNFKLIGIFQVESLLGFIGVFLFYS
jgi:hypothetical protein